MEISRQNIEREVFNVMIHHIEIYVRHLDKSKRFYKMILERLGYQLFQEWGEGFSLKLGGTYIVFVQVEDKYKKNDYHRKNVGLNHVAFSVTNRREVDELRTFLKDEDVSLLYDEQYPFAGGDSHYAVYFEDPDRIKLEVVAEDE